MTMEEAVEVLKERYLTCVGIGLDNHANRVNEAIDMAIEALSAEARPTGEWKEVYAETDYCNGWIEFSCECCGHQHGLESGEYGWSYGEPIPWKFCPLCGAKMGGDDE